MQEGGNLIAVRPQGAWLPIFGLAPDGDAVTARYLQVDAGAPAARGIARQAMQFHGPARRYRPEEDATILARLSTGAEPLPWPAVSLHRYGRGQAAAFAFDLATSVVRLRQGNPAFAGQERDGLPPRRPNDLFFPDYLDLSRVAIPQADEQQRLLANLIVTMSAERLPLPRVWYLPDERRAALIMAGDDHAPAAARSTPTSASSPRARSIAGPRPGTARGRPPTSRRRRGSRRIRRAPTRRSASRPESTPIPAAATSMPPPWAWP